MAQDESRVECVFFFPVHYYTWHMEHDRKSGLCSAARLVIPCVVFCHRRQMLLLISSLWRCVRKQQSRYHRQDLVETGAENGSADTSSEAAPTLARGEIPVVDFILLHLLLLVSVPVLQLLLRLLPPLDFRHLGRRICRETTFHFISLFLQAGTRTRTLPKASYDM